MTSEIRANSITSRAGMSTVTMTDSGPMFSGITTFVDNSGFTFGVGGGTSIFTPATNVLTFGTNNTEKIRIDASGHMHGVGVITATHFYGDGSNLTGISAGTSLSGSTNNTVCTVTGANAIQGESTLTYDGNKLKFGGGSRSLDNGYYDDIVIDNSDTTSGEAGGSGISIISGNASWCGLIFGDNDDHQRGYIKYSHQDEFMQLVTASGGGQVRIESGGSVGITSVIHHLNDADTNFGFPANDSYRLRVAGSTRLYTSSSEPVWNRRDVNAGITTQTMLLNYNSGAGTGCALAFAPSGVNYSARHSSIEVVNDDGNNNMSMRFKVTDASQNAHAVERMRINKDGKFCLGTFNSNYASNDGVVSIVNAASSGTENPLLTLWNPTTVADARASIDFLTNAQYGTARDGAFIRASNDGSTAKAHLIFGTILNETYTKTVKFDTNGDVELVDGDLVIQTSGHGIDFSARSGSNAGATSSILDDYEEGVYQPTMTGSGGGSHTFVTYTHLAYTKVGRVVHIQGYINTNGGSLSGNLKLSLPFTVSNDATGHSRYAAIGLSWRGHGWSGNTGEITFAPQPNTTYGEFVSVSNNGSHIWVNNGHVNNNYNIRIGGSYITNS